VKEPRPDSPIEILSTEKAVGFLFRIQKRMKGFKFGKCSRTCGLKLLGSSESYVTSLVRHPIGLGPYTCGFPIARQLRIPWRGPGPHLLLRNYSQIPTVYTVVDGEIVALDDAGRPNFNFLEHSHSQAKRICYFVSTIAISPTRRECCALGSAEGRAGDAGGFLIHLILFPAT
jgi:hypothetical protein